MERFLISYPKMLIVLLSLFSLLLETAIVSAQSNGIVFHTSQSINNLNPFSYRTYPEELIIQFTTDKLIHQLCTRSKDHSKGFIPGIQISKCLHDDYNKNASIFDININKKSDINKKDIADTIDKINQTSFNRYSGHQLILKDNKIKINNPEKAAFSTAGAALTFPIIKANKIFPQTSISGKDDIDLFNKATTGRYCLKDFQQFAVELKGRNNTCSPLTFNIDVLWEHFSKNIMADKVHIGLSVSGQLLRDIKRLGKYRLEETDDLNSFTYFGFNYNIGLNDSESTKNETKRSRINRVLKLFANIDFRQAFAFSVCSNDAVRDFFARDATPFNHTFDSFRGDENHSIIDYTKEIPGKINKYIRRIKQSEKVMLRILYRADMTFTQDKMDTIIETLNNNFVGSNISFRGINAFHLSQFSAKKKSLDFDIILETYVYGQNKLRYIEFMNPDNKSTNFLGCKFFTTEQISVYKKIIEKRDDFLLKVNRKLPVFVLGSFLIKNVISTQIINRHSCKGFGRALPFSNIHQWQIKDNLLMKQP